ncbi:T9SS type B sorting domain-containing protein [Flavobacterium alkalisoli]|uniref:T9SS type B sorting domain-containing protein n=1 Tax=Flavobacterium alkalisoli TaxID=2602769 RepID=A0A5B9FXB2_9FLAO|nr:T9SS type B sorting domain-containing protein [Flavobacterium alkalisoli]QEE50979.1 T9SS type B sorting domain-containing protein [Flavobacterium alkalisoli]
MRLILALLLLTISLQAQEHNIWYFGAGAGLDFNNGVPTALSDGQIQTSEGTASISDSEGNLLFYTDGRTIWNQTHQIMENGQDLMGHYSATQSALIIPKPGSQQRFYVFTVTAWGEANGFRYSEIDMTVNTGLGAVIDKNILVQTPVAEALNATWHSNGEDIWVVVHGFENNLFYAYLVTSAGVSLNPVTSTSLHPSDAFGQSSIKISPDGSKLAFTRLNGQNGLQLFDFDNSTGLITNPLLLHGPGCYSTDFSSSGNILYMTRGDSLRQYNLLAADISASAVIINIDETVRLSSIQRGPDNKIYIARYLQDYVSVINNPEILGTGCNFESVGINNLGTNSIPPRYSTNGLPNTVLTSVLRINQSNQALCVGELATFSINLSTQQFDSILWDFGDGGTSQENNPSHAYQLEGLYTVILSTNKQGIFKTAQLDIVVSPIPQITQPAAMVMCDETSNGTAVFSLGTQNSVLVGSQAPDDYLITYHLSAEDAELGNNSIAENFTNTASPQTIFARLEAINSGCYATTSFDLIVNPQPVIDMADNFPLCKGETILLEAPVGFEAYHWSTGHNDRTITVDTPGTYTVSVGLTVNGTWCGSSKTVTVYTSEAPTITQVSTDDWTASHNSISISVSGSGSYEYSLDGVTYQDSPEFNRLDSGIYNVYARDKNGCGIDMKEIVLLMYPRFFTPNDDGVNDTWRISYAWLEPNAMVHIFDRYGKRIVSFRGDSVGWDGKYHGSNLPATDYWFVVERESGRVYKGHFSLVR